MSTMLRALGRRVRAHTALTETDLPDTADTPQRRTWPNTHQVCHRWAANRHNYGEAGNVFFDGGVIFSYGQHFPVARHVRVKAGGPGRPGAKFILFTSRGYSVSTACHKSAVRGAIPPDTTVYTVPDVLANAASEHRENIRAKISDARVVLARAGRARANAAGLRGEAAGILTAAADYAGAVGLDIAIPSPDGEDLAAWAERAAADERRQQEAEREAGKRRRAHELRAWRKRLAAWQAGGDDWPGGCPNSFAPEAGFTFLRVKGRALETSGRAAVPLRAALPILAAIRSGTAPAVGCLVDGFELRAFDREGKTVTVGCHRVTFKEILRAAAAAGL